MSADYALPDRGELSDYQQRVSQLPGDARERAETAYRRLETACWLSNGPSEDRSAAWRPRALIRRKALDAILRTSDSFPDETDED